jgi:PTH2 family peptidyl-tRNA hydrolase
MKKTKQVLIIRKDLNMRKGKIAAQASHASNAILTNILIGYPFSWTKFPFRALSFFYYFFFKPPFRQWLIGSFTKACVYVESEQELLDYYDQAVNEKILASKIKDSGRTEFHGVPTWTAVAIGPDYEDKINQITGKLTLY